MKKYSFLGENMCSAGIASYETLASNTPIIKSKSYPKRKSKHKRFSIPNPMKK